MRGMGNDMGGDAALSSEADAVLAEDGSLPATKVLFAEWLTAEDEAAFADL